MQRTATVSWFLKFGIGALALLVVCAFANAWIGNDQQMPATTTRDGALITLNRYAIEPVPEVVLVGSSLTFRLKEEYFAAARLRNLALAGGSPVTGLEIVAHQRRLPRIVLVEANLLSRPIDTALVERYSRGEQTKPVFLRPVRQAVATYEHWLHAPLSHEQASAAIDQLLRRPPSDFDNQTYMERAWAEMNALDPTLEVRRSVQTVKELIGAMEKRGTRALLFELPFSERLEGALAVKTTKAIVHAAFPDPARWLRLDLPIGELRWADGVHLDERSAIIVSQRIEEALKILAPAVTAQGAN